MSEGVVRPTGTGGEPRGSAKAALAAGLWRDNPIMVQTLGICSALAVTNRVETALVMSAAVTFVVVMTGIMVSVLRRFTPERIRLIVWISLIGTFVILVDQFCKAFLWEISLQLGPYVGLIIVNCIILGRAEAFASRQNPVLSALDGLGNGLGYGVVLCVVAVVRELLGTGRIMMTNLLGSEAPLVQLGPWYVPNDYWQLPSGAFIVLGTLIAALAWVASRRSRHV